MITKKQLKIMAVFEKEIFSKLTFREIKESAREKSNNIIQISVAEFLDKELIIKSVKGNLGLYRLNLKNSETFHYLSLIQEERLKRYDKEAQKTIAYLKKEIIEKNPFCSIVLFGSYAEFKQKKGSDIDIAIITNNKEQEKEYLAVLKTLKLRTVAGIDPHIITRYELKEMLLKKQENLGKQIARKSTPLYNNRIFYQIIKEAKESGFYI